MTAALALEEVDVDLYRAPADALWQPPAGRSVFGGQILAQACVAANRSLQGSTAADADAGGGFVLASLHSYFLQGGDHSRPILYRVARLRDGKSFASRSVVASQRGQNIFSAEMLFAKEEVGELEHQVAMPDVPEPETLPSHHALLASYLSDPRLRKEQRPFLERYSRAPFPVDVRAVRPADPFDTRAVTPARHQVWMRCTEDLGPPERAVGAHASFLHTAALTYASDWSLASTMMLPHAITWGSPRIAMAASLDHCMWFASAAAPFRADQWLLYDMESSVMRGSRGLNAGSIFTRDGRLVVSCTQEAVLRTRPAARSSFGGGVPAAG